MPVDTPLRVLVMDPSPSSRSHVAVGMRQLGVDVDGVGTLEQASDVLSMRHYDLVIVDPQQPRWLRAGDDASLQARHRL